MIILLDNIETSLDSIERTNLYLYVGNDPINRVDPLGLQATTTAPASITYTLEPYLSTGGGLEYKVKYNFPMAGNPVLIQTIIIKDDVTGEYKSIPGNKTTVGELVYSTGAIDTISSGNYFKNRIGEKKCHVKYTREFTTEFYASATVDVKDDRGNVTNEPYDPQRHGGAQGSMQLTEISAPKQTSVFENKYTRDGKEIVKLVGTGKPLLIVTHSDTIEYDIAGGNPTNISATIIWNTGDKTLDTALARTITSTDGKTAPLQVPR